VLVAGWIPTGGVGVFVTPVEYGTYNN